MSAQLHGMHRKYPCFQELFYGSLCRGLLEEWGVSVHCVQLLATGGGGDDGDADGTGTDWFPALARRSRPRDQPERLGVPA